MTMSAAVAIDLYFIPTVLDCSLLDLIAIILSLPLIQVPFSYFSCQCSYPCHSRTPFLISIIIISGGRKEEDGSTAVLRPASNCGQ